MHESMPSCYRGQDCRHWEISAAQDLYEWVVESEKNLLIFTSLPLHNVEGVWMMSGCGVGAGGAQGVEIACRVYG